MTSISSTQAMRHQSPLLKLQQTLAADISSGKISAADKSALSSALDTIDSAMQSGSRVSPEDGKAKVESMIQDMVSDGTLTADQAEELNTVFSDTFSGGPGGAKGPKGAGGPPPPPPGDEDSDESSDVTLSLTGSSTDIATMLKKLLESLASNGTSTYSSSASSNTNVSSLFLDKTA
jgi:hypothetical protein